MESSTDFTYTLNDEEELALMKTRAMRCKVICLDKMGKHPLTNPKYLKAREKNLLIKAMKAYIDNKSDSEIEKEFNEVCLDKLFDCDTDVSAYPVYNPNPELETTTEEQ